MALVERLAQEFDVVYLVVSVQNPFKDEGSNNFNERLENVKAIIERKGLTNVIVEDIESTLEPPYYTINTLNKLEEKYPDIILSYCVGGDCLIDFDKWKDWESILTHFGLTIIPRKGYNHKTSFLRLRDLAEEPEYWQVGALSDCDIPEVSSTEIRAKIANGEDVSELLP